MKIPKPGVDLFLLFFDRLGFGFRCLGERVAIRVQFHILDFSLFLSSYRASKCHIPNNPFFNITLPLPNHMDGHFPLTVFSTGVGFVRGAICRCDMVLFPYYIKYAESPLEEDKFECGLLGPISHPISTIACSFFCISR